MHTIASYFPDLAIPLATTGSSKEPGTQATCAHVRRRKGASGRPSYSFAHFPTAVAPEQTRLPVYAALLTSTFSASTPCRWNTSWAPSSSGLVTKLLKRATTTPNLGGGGGGGVRVQGSEPPPHQTWGEEEEEGQGSGLRATTTPNLGGGGGGVRVQSRRVVDVCRR